MGTPKRARRPRNDLGSGILAWPPNKALKLTKPAKERALRHCAAQDDAPCRVARSSLMWASQLNAVLGGS